MRKMLSKIKRLFKTKDVSIIAPTKLRDGTGMSRSFITPDLLTQDGKCIITDTKDEIEKALANVKEN